MEEPKHEAPTVAVEPVVGHLPLVERLRKWPDLPGANWGTVLMTEAADEIERLSTLLREIAARYEAAPFGLPVGDDENAYDNAATDYLHWLGIAVEDFAPNAKGQPT